MFYKKTKKKKTNTMKTRKLGYTIQTGGTIVSLGTNSEKYKIIVDYFNLSTINGIMYSRFIMTSLKECFSIFSTINWISKIEYSSNNSDSESNTYNNITEHENIKPKDYNNKLPKKNFYNESITKGLEECLISDSTFENIGMYSKFYKNDGYIIKCILYKKNDDRNYFYVIFNFGETINFYNHNLSIKKVARFIYKKLNKSVVNKLVLFGFSMGGNIAQHVVLELLKDKKQRISSDKLTLINLSSGKNIIEDDYNLILEKLNGRCLSFSLISSNELNMSDALVNDAISNDKKKITINIDPVFNDGSFPGGFTLPSILINYVNNPLNNDVHTIKYYSYDYLRNIPTITFKNNRELHDFTILRKYLCS
jgi:hypothetical protein